MREHASDPQFMTHVIRQGPSPVGIQWDRWSSWERGDARWRVRIIDTSALPVGQVADEPVAWIDAETELFRSGQHPLSKWAE